MLTHSPAPVSESVRNCAQKSARTEIQARRAQHLAIGDVVKLNPSDRRRVLSIAEVPGTIWFIGTWELLTGPAARREPFMLPFLRWMTIETVEGKQDAR